MILIHQPISLRKTISSVCLMTAAERSIILHSPLLRLLSKKHKEPAKKQNCCATLQLVSFSCQVHVAGDSLEQRKSVEMQDDGKKLR